MRVLFLQDNAINESLALTELSAYLRAHGHQTAVLIEREERDFLGEAERFDPGLVVLPIGLLAHNWGIRTAMAIKTRLEVTVVMGGPHPTFYPETILCEVQGGDWIDALVQGEAETTVLELVETLERGGDISTIASVVVRDGDGFRANPARPLVRDLDTIPMPDRGLYFDRYPYMGRFSFKKFTTGRGCVHSCSYCFNSLMRVMYRSKGPYIRRKSPERAVSEVAAVEQTYGLGNAHFSDDLFITMPDWLEEFAALYRRQVTAGFTCNSSAEAVTERAVRALALAGCKGVAIGIETGNEQLRMSILNKKVTNEHIRHAATLIKGHGMKLVTFNIVGAPGETPDDVLSTIRLNQEIGTDIVRVNMAVPIPKTEFAREGQRRGLLASADALAAFGDAASTGGTAYFDGPHRRHFLNLLYWFRLAVHTPRLNGLVERVMGLPSFKALQLLELMAPYNEKRFYDLGWMEGLRYFRHVGSPQRRTTNFASLI